MVIIMVLKVLMEWALMSTIILQVMSCWLNVDKHQSVPLRLGLKYPFASLGLVFVRVIS